MDDAAPVSVVEAPNKREATWHKARLPTLAASATAETALVEIVNGCVEHLRGNTACVAARAHVEGVHQMRVAARRLRSCLALFEPYLPAEQRRYLEIEIKWLIGELGPARDWDVFVADILRPVERQFPEEDRLALLRTCIEGLRDQAYARAQAAIASQRFIGLLLLLSSWAEGRGWRTAADGAAIGERLQARALEVSRELLGAIYRGALEAGDNFAELDPEARHKVRIQLKKLRYATEFFASLYPRRKVEPYLTVMKALQDDLGLNNDVHVARKLLKKALKGTRGKARAQQSYAAGLVVGWHAHHQEREQDLLRDWRQFAGRAPYWAPAQARSVAVSQPVADAAAVDAEAAGPLTSPPATNPPATTQPAAGAGDAMAEGGGAGTAAAPPDPAAVVEVQDGAKP